MKYTIVLELLQNAAILLAFSMLYDYYWLKNAEPANLVKKIIIGIIIGGIGILLMLTPWTFKPGIVFDTRSILLSISGLFFGFIPTILAILITVVYRISMGGDGMWMGISVIITSGTIGIIWKYFRPQWQHKNRLLELLSLGFIVHVVMLVCTLFLPSNKILKTFTSIALPVIIIYPIGTLLLGNIMVRRSQYWQARKALKESEDKYQRLYSSMKDAYAMVDLSGKILEFNPAYREMLGYSEQELKLLTYKEITLEKWHSMELDIIREQVLINGSSRVYEKEYIHKSGAIFPVELRTFLLNDEKGEKKGYWAIVRDITERKKVEHELIIAKDKAEENDRLKSVFLANMSHEIRTPMNAIMGFSSLLGNDNLTVEKKSHFIKNIEISSGRLLQIINDIIDISKLEAKQLIVASSLFNVYETINFSIESFRKSAMFCNKPELEFILNYKQGQEFINLNSDMNRFQQVLDNLINNAIKFTRKGFIELGFDIKTENGIQYIETYVKDSGIGIPEDKQVIIFERFRQVEEYNYHEGAGIGLSLSKGIVELLGGKIWFSTEYLKGTTFYFTIPLNISTVQ